MYILFAFCSVAPGFIEVTACLLVFLFPSLIGNCADDCLLNALLSCPAANWFLGIVLCSSFGLSLKLGAEGVGD